MTYKEFVNKAYPIYVGSIFKSNGVHLGALYKSKKDPELYLIKHAYSGRLTFLSNDELNKEGYAVFN